MPSNSRKASRDYRALKKTYKDLLDNADEESLEDFNKEFEKALGVYAYM